MAIHKIKCDNFVLWTGDKGIEMLNKAFKEEVDRQIAILNEKEATEQLENKIKSVRYEQLKPENIHYYQRPTREEILEMHRHMMTEEEYEEILAKWNSPYSLDVKRPHWNDEDKEDDEEE